LSTRDLSLGATYESCKSRWEHLWEAPVMNWAFQNIDETWRRAFDKRNPIVCTEGARKVLLDVLREKETSVLKAWFRHFDRDFSGSISVSEFREGVIRLRFPGGDAHVIWVHLDPEGVGEIALEEICAQHAYIWNRFRRFCGARFRSSRDMVAQLKQQAAWSETHGGAPPRHGLKRQSVGSISEELGLAKSEWKIGLRQFDWEDGHEELLFEALDLDEDGIVRTRDLQPWLGPEAQRFQKKQEARQLAALDQKRKAAARQLGWAMVKDFRHFIRHSFGPTYHAWRRALDPAGTMQVPRADLFKLCRQMNWTGDIRALWKALDFDGNGTTTIEELDLQCARTLAQFKDWATRNYGKKPMNPLWIDMAQQRRKLTCVQFAAALAERNFNHKVKTIVLWLDWEGKKYIHEEDLRFLDSWRMPPWLVCIPEMQAALDFKRHLQHRYGNSLRAWRLALDKDFSNFCNWHEFHKAAKHLNFQGNVPGAWLALDQDLSGSINFQAIDPDSHACLATFVKWAKEEFGSVALAMKAFDKDQTLALSFKELRYAARIFGYDGNVRRLYEIIDQESAGCVLSRDLAFLDRWDWLETELDPEVDGHLEEVAASQMEHTESMEEKAMRSVMLEYKTLGPGPGAYEICCSFGAKPNTPNAKHAGSYSFKGRRKLGHVVPSVVGPGFYDVSTTVDAHQRPRKPAWSFGRDSRSVTPLLWRDETPSPGPGAYNARSRSCTPQFSIGNRRPHVMHPLQRIVAFR